MMRGCFSSTPRLIALSLLVDTRSTSQSYIAIIQRKETPALFNWGRV